MRRDRYVVLHIYTQARGRQWYVGSYDGPGPATLVAGPFPSKREARHALDSLVRSERSAA